MIEARRAWLPVRRTPQEINTTPYLLGKEDTQDNEILPVSGFVFQWHSPALSRNNYNYCIFISRMGILVKSLPFWLGLVKLWCSSLMDSTPWLSLGAPLLSKENKRLPNPLNTLVFPRVVSIHGCRSFSQDI